MRKEPQKSRKSAANGAAKTDDRTGRPTGAMGNVGGVGIVDFGRQALGRLVQSTAGHDKGSFLVIIGVADENHVLTADGRLRTVGKPKLKKLRHIKVTCFESEALRTKLIEGLPILDAELRKFIAECREKAGGDEPAAEADGAK